MNPEHQNGEVLIEDKPRLALSEHDSDEDLMEQELL